MKKILILLAAVFVFTGCYKDKGDYNYASWSGIELITPLTIAGGGTLFVGDQLVIDPVVEYKEGYSVSDYTFEWIVGEKTVASTLKLDWIVASNESVKNNETTISLRITSKKSNESFTTYINDGFSSVKKIKLYRREYPVLGAIITQNGTNVDWATIKASKSNFVSKIFDGLTVETDVYAKYNGASIQGEFTSATLTRQELILYTKTGGEVVSFGSSTSFFGSATSVYENGIFEANVVASKPIQSIDAFENLIQSALVGGELYSLPCNTTDYPYVSLNPASGTGFRSGVEQIAYPMPLCGMGHFSLVRYINGDIKMLKIPTSAGAPAEGAALKEGAAALSLDKIIGVFAQGGIVNTYTTMNFFVVGVKNNALKMCQYTVSSSATSATTTYVKTIDISLWAGGALTDKSLWFSTTEGTINTVFDPAFVASGSKLYRFNHVATTQAPVEVPVTFTGDITVALSCANDPKSQSAAAKSENELYTIVCTYNQASNKSSIYLLDTYSGVLFKKFENVVDGKIVKYLPNYLNN